MSKTPAGSTQPDLTPSAEGGGGSRRRRMTALSGVPAFVHPALRRVAGGGHKWHPPGIPTGPAPSADGSVHLRD